MSSSSSLVTAERQWCVRPGYDRAAPRAVTTFFYATPVTIRPVVRSSLQAVSRWNVTPMVPYADDARLITSLPTVEEILDDHASQLGRDLIGYRNHVYRVANLCLAIARHRRVELEKIAVAAVFHDLGIWTNKTFDYIGPSVAIAREHLTARGMADWIPEIEAMIVDHHKLTPSRTN